MTYQEHKNKLRKYVMRAEVYQQAITWSELASMYVYIEKQAKRYGLIKELKSEGILWYYPLFTLKAMDI